MRIEKKNWRKNYSLFNWLCKFLFAFIVFVGCLSCQTLFGKKTNIPGDLSTYKSGSFSGTMMVRQKNKKRYFTVDVLVSEEDKLRMDFLISFGVPVFLFLSEKKSITLLSLQTKEFYKGRSIQKAFPSFFPVNLDFSVFREIFFDRKPEGKQWKCEMSTAGNLPIKCEYKTWVIKWEREKKRLLSLEGTEFELVFRYLSFSSEVNDTMFTFKIPENFKQVLLLK